MAGPVIIILPFTMSLWIGLVVVVVGILSIARAAVLSSKKRPP